LLFVDASFQLNPGEKVGLVGPSGAGKTTLFRMVVGEETPDEGAVSVPKKLTIGYFRQDGFVEIEFSGTKDGPSANMR
jgi:ATPase subunit of ABC transporter with duplicated ATPase domains